MWKTLKSILLGRAARAEQSLETQNAALIIEQKLREAEAGHQSAKRGLAALVARMRAEQKALDGIETRIVDLDARTRAALAAGKETLARDAAGLIAELENEREARRAARDSAEEKAGRMRLAIERTERRLTDLRQGLHTAKSIEAERAVVGRLQGDLSATSAIAEGEAVLQRLLKSDDPVAEADALEEIEASLSGDAVVDRLADAGFGPARKVRADDILSRYRAEADATAPEQSPA